LDVLHSGNSRLGKPVRTPAAPAAPAAPAGGTPTAAPAAPAAPAGSPAPTSTSYTTPSAGGYVSFTFNKGGKLEQLRALRQNFTTDTTNKFAQGGIIKAQNGANAE